MVAAGSWLRLLAIVHHLNRVQHKWPEFLIGPFKHAGIGRVHVLIPLVTVALPHLMEIPQFVSVLDLARRWLLLLLW